MFEEVVNRLTKKVEDGIDFELDTSKLEYSDVVAIIDMLKDMGYKVEIGDKILMASSL